MIHLGAATATSSSSSSSSSSPAATAPVEHGEQHKDLHGVRPSKCHRGRCSARIMCLWTFLLAAMLPVMYCTALLGFSWGPVDVFKAGNVQLFRICAYLLLKKQPFSLDIAFLFIWNLFKPLRRGWGTLKCFPPANCRICSSSWSALPHFLSSAREHGEGGL